MPFSLGFSALASVVVCLYTPQDSDEVLFDFYKNVRPWGFWGPVHDKLLAKYPNMKKNMNLGRDWLNIAIGIVWQLMLMVVPTCLVIRNYQMLWMSLGVLAVTSVVMKFTWYDTLGENNLYITDTEEVAAE